MPNAGSTVDAAIAQLRAGERLQAETAVATAVREAEAREGRGSALWAAAQFDLARVLLELGDAQRAMEALRQACTMRGTTTAETIARLTYQVNLGQVLLTIGNAHEAERVLRGSLEERGKAFGTDHAGYAFGLEALADALIANGDAAQAVALAEQAATWFETAKHARFVQSAALRAIARKAAYGNDAVAFQEVSAWDDPTVWSIAQECLAKCAGAEPRIALAVLRELRDALAKRCGSETSRLVPWVVGIATAARAVPSPSDRQEALAWLVNVFDRQDDAANAIDAVIGTALAHEEAGSPHEAQVAYEEALRRARSVKNAGLLTDATRSYGLFLQKSERLEDAERMLREAVRHAESSVSDEQRGAASIALGILLQHGGQLQEARGILETGLGCLPATHPDALAARSHRDAIDRGTPCGCVDMRDALSSTLQDMVRQHLPEGLLERLIVGYDDKGGLDLQVRLVREPTPSERELVDRVLRQAVAELREKIQDGL